MKFKIVSNKPTPPDAGRTGPPAKYPFGEMKVGQSFFCNGQKNRSVQRAASGYGKRHNLRFATRKEGNGYRIWRVE